MPHSRYYIDLPFEANQSVTLDKEESHHLLHVLRAQIEDRVELINGRGQLAQALLTKIEKHSATLFLTTLTTTPPPPSLILALAISRMNHLEWVIEKGCELNATAFYLFPGLLSEKKDLSSSQIQRLKSLSIAAMKQCGRLDLPSIALHPPLLQWKPIDGTLLFGDTAPDVPYLWDLSLPTPLSSPVFIFIGPEKGFDPKERDFLFHSLKAKGIRLHPNILRTETAPLTALSLIQQLI